MIVITAWADFSAQKVKILNRLLINFNHSNSNTYSSAIVDKHCRRPRQYRRWIYTIWHNLTPTQLHLRYWT